MHHVRTAPLLSSPSREQTPSPPPDEDDDDDDDDDDFTSASSASSSPVSSRRHSPAMSPFNLETCARPNILALQPYRCARDDYKENGVNILLDANENAFGPAILPAHVPTSTSPSSPLSGIDPLGLHRYPDPHQHDLKQLLCSLRNTHAHTPKSITPDHLFVGVGSDEAIDALIRCFCVPGKDSILICPPTYGMYGVSAQVNDVGVVKVPLLPGPSFALDVPAITAALSSSSSSPQEQNRSSGGGGSSNIKLAYFCSPGNPTGSLLAKSDILKILDHPTWNGVVVLDEAYIDFAGEDASLAELAAEYPNLVVLQTLSKAFGMAGIRLGAAFTSPPIAHLLNNMKAPYNVPSPTSALARHALGANGLAAMRDNLAKISLQRDRMQRELAQMPGLGRLLGGTASNFLLYEVLSPESGTPDNTTAMAVYKRLAEKTRVIVRFRGHEHGCEGCLRITVGTPDEVTELLRALSWALDDVKASLSS
ncbi:hypothetical protein E4U21_005852 [Claviceps maximensis]|nr:hypothetical protein E4U21_005852 [Claviceps maximensis]